MQKDKATAPSTLPELLKLVGTSLLRNLVWRLLFAMAIGFGVWIVHTYVVVVVNEGFNLSGSSWSRHWLAVRGQRLWGSVSWFMPAFLLFWIARRVLFHPWRFTKSALAAPMTLWRQSRDAGLWSLAALPLGMGLGLTLGTLSASPPWVAGWLGIGLFALLEPSRSVSGWLGRLVTGRGDGGAAVIWAGLAVGLITALPLPLQPYTGVIGTLGMAIATVPLAVLAWRQPKLAALVLVCLSTAALADDGGWREAGGTFDQWVTSRGATEALLSGLGPATASVIAILTALGLPDLPELPGVSTSSPDAAPDAAGVSKPPRWLSDLKDTLGNTFGAPGGREIFEALLAATRGVNSNMDQLLATYGRLMRDGMEVLEGGMVRFKDPALRDQLLEQMRVLRGVKDAADRIGSALNLFGVAMDAWDNMSKGDSWQWALGKAGASGTVMGKIMERNPAVAILEAATWITLGGTEAGEAISPGKNLGGGFNLLADTLYDGINGTDTAHERMHKGDYGKTVQHLAGAAEIGAEFWEDPETVGEELAAFVTEDRVWSDAYQRSAEIWRGPKATSNGAVPPIPPPSAWDPRPAVRWAGEAATNAAIAAGRGVAIIADAAGDPLGAAEGVTDFAKQTWNRWFG